MAHQDQVFEVDTVRCYARRAIEQVRRTERERAKSEKRPEGHDDGLIYFAHPHKNPSSRREA